MNNENIQEELNQTPNLVEKIGEVIMAIVGSVALIGGLIYGISVTGEEITKAFSNMENPIEMMVNHAKNNPILFLGELFGLGLGLKIVGRVVRKYAPTVFPTAHLPKLSKMQIDWNKYNWNRPKRYILCKNPKCRHPIELHEYVDSEFDLSKCLACKDCLDFRG